MRKLDKTSLYHAANGPIFKSLNLQPSTVSFRLTDNLRRVYWCKGPSTMPLEVPYNLSVRRALLNLQSGTVFNLIENPHSSTQGQCTKL